MLLHDAERHEKCPCIPSSVYATAPRKCRNQEQNHPFCERMSEVATTANQTLISHHTPLTLVPIWSLARHYRYSLPFSKASVSRRGFQEPGGSEASPMILIPLISIGRCWPQRIESTRLFVFAWNVLSRMALACTCERPSIPRATACCPPASSCKTHSPCARY